MVRIGSIVASLLALTTSYAHATDLVVAGRDGVYQDALAMAISMYSESNPDAAFEQLALPYDGLLQQTTLSARENVDAYDVIMIDDTWATQYMSNNWLADLDALGGGLDEDFAQAMRDVSKYPYGSGTTYAVPFVGNVALFAYRMDLMDRPESWDDVLDAAAEINARDGMSGLVFRGVKANPIVTGFLPVLWAYGGEVVDGEGHSALNSDASVAALEAFLDLAEYAPRGVAAYNASEVRNALMQGTTGMAIELWPSWAPDLDNPEQSQVVGDVGIIAAPGQVEASSPMLGSWLLAVPANAPNPEAARDFIDFVTSAEVQKQLALEIGTPPTRGSVYNDDDVVAQYRWYPEQFEALTNARPRPRITQWAEVETILGDYLQLALIGDMEPAEAIAAAHGRIARALDN